MMDTHNEDGEVRERERLRLTYSWSVGTRHTYIRAQVLLDVAHTRSSPNDTLEEQFVLLRHFTVALIVIVRGCCAPPQLINVISKLVSVGRVRDWVRRVTV